MSEADISSPYEAPTVKEVGEIRPCTTLYAIPAMTPATMTAARDRSFLSSLAFIPTAPALSSPLTIHGRGQRHDAWSAARHHYSTKVVSCAPSSATNTAISSAVSVALAFADTRCVAPGGSKNDCPTLKVSTGPPASCERISPLVM